MKAAILGVGKMGIAITFAMKKLGFFVVGIDSNERAAEEFRKRVDAAEGTFYLTDDTEEKGFANALSHEKPDIVISSLPYHQLEKPALWCIDNGVRYCDLGGKVNVSEKINKYASTNASKPVFTDLGLAPGWVNILAEWGCSKMHGAQIDDVRMMVGGIPSQKINHPLDYVVTWSVDGLINEYKDDCKIIKNGKIETVKGMDGLERMNGGNFGMLEAFYTSGGASHTIDDMHGRGVKNCSYRTVRYEGHRDIVKFLMDNLTGDCFRQVFEKGCNGAPNVVDVVLLKTLVRSKELVWDKDLLIVGEENGLSGMQQATAFPIASVAKIMAEGKLEGDMEQRGDHWAQFPNNLSYKNVPFEQFNNNLLALGLSV